ncbi:MAG: type II toxin-antitoxin system ParD family antitoxin [Rivularia sp. (in: cyanobacteria)]
MNHEYIPQKQKEIDNKHLEALLIEGLESGKPVEINKEWWKKKQAELIQRLQKQK